MRRAIVALSLVGALITPGASVGAASPSGLATPYVEYRAALQAYEASLADRSIPPDVLGVYESGLALIEAEQARLETVTPEACYATAHAELLAFRTDEAANYRDARPMFEQAESMMGMLGTALMIESILASAHPLAYPVPLASPSSISLGPDRDLMRMMDTLQTCLPASSLPPS